MDLSAQEGGFSDPDPTEKLRPVPVARNGVVPYIRRMDRYLAAGLAMLLLWGVLTVRTEAPGWVHLLLTAGVFVVIWRLVVRGTPDGPS
jgi:hypothetical protein